MTWYLPNALKPTADAAQDTFLYIERTPVRRVQHPSFAKNELHFLFFYRTLVWDHAPGVLIAEEAGGLVRRLDGTEYSPVDDRKGLLCANSRKCGHRYSGRWCRPSSCRHDLVAFYRKKTGGCAAARLALR